MKRLAAGIVAAVVSALLSFPPLSSAPAHAATWSIQRAPVPAGATDDVLRGISCATSDACVAVGGPDDEPGVMLAERWDGTRWSIQRTPRPPDSIQSLLGAVSCASLRACTAVGYTVPAGRRISSIAVRWNGARWTIARPPTPRGAVQSFLTAISCPAQTACTAVGGYEDRSGSWLALAEHWNGSRWTVQRVPAIPYSELFGVSCPAADACTAVGVRDSVVAVVERWNGVRWAIAPGGDLDWAESELHAIACTSRSACAAGGEAVIPSLFTWPLLETWTAGRWTAQPVRSQPPGIIYGIACTPHAACTAVGADALIERLGRGRWSVERAPDPQRSVLYGVSCPAMGCVAVGSRVTTRGYEVPLVESTLKPAAMR